ncbi:MAG: FHA domain-containing protein, partial [Propionibacteriaceae bacterium]|nr:FHA domain-containing protein [Propionibacteriaceae bacterium]
VPEPQEEQASYDADDEVSFEAFDPAPDPLRAPTYEAGPEEIAAALAGVPAGLPGMPQTSGVSVPSPAAVDEFVPEEEQEPAQEDDEELVLAAPCTNGHANAPGSHRCRICKYPVDSSNPRLIRRPTLAGVHTNRGDFADVISGVIVGRAPDASKGPAGSYLMRVLSPGNDISRSHVLVSTQGWNVHVTDLHSTNGTTVLPDGEAPFTLRDGATVEVSIGTVLDLGDGVSLRIEPPRG